MTKYELQSFVGQNLRRISLEQGLTIEQVAERVGISTTFYSNLECGNKMMSVETMWKLANVLCVSADAILLGDDSDERIKSIDMLLRNQSSENLEFIEKLIRLCVSDLPKEKKLQEGVMAQDECGTE